MLPKFPVMFSMCSICYKPSFSDEGVCMFANMMSFKFSMQDRRCSNGMNIHPILKPENCSDFPQCIYWSKAPCNMPFAQQFKSMYLGRFVGPCTWAESAVVVDSYLCHYGIQIFPTVWLLYCYFHSPMDIGTAPSRARSASCLSRAWPMDLTLVTQKEAECTRGVLPTCPKGLVNGPCPSVSEQGRMHLRGVFPSA
jgi:hypothetical protein